MAEYTPRRSSGQVTARFQPATGRRTATDQFSPHQAALTDLERIATEATAHGYHGWADSIRDAARRLT